MFIVYVFMNIGVCACVQELLEVDKQLVKMQDAVKIREAMSADQKDSIMELKDKLSDAQSANTDWVKREEDLLTQLDEFMDSSDKYRQREADAKEECAHLATRVQEKDGLAQQERDAYEEKLAEKSTLLQRQVEAIAYAEGEITSMQEQFQLKEGAWRAKVQQTDADRAQALQHSRSLEEKVKAMSQELLDAARVAQDKTDACEAMRMQVEGTEDEMRTILAEMKKRQQMASKFASLWQV
jgi:chromosome segregation ATPase